MTTDDELDVALALFNEGLERQQADRRVAKAIERAEKAKQQAAATLKRLQDDAGASADDRAAAEAAYREAVTTFNALRNGETPPTADAGAAEDGAAEDGGPDADQEPPGDDPSDDTSGAPAG